MCLQMSRRCLLIMFPLVLFQAVLSYAVPSIHKLSDMPASGLEWLNESCLGRINNSSQGIASLRDKHVCILLLQAWLSGRKFHIRT